jgi:hypothetical protein
MPLADPGRIETDLLQITNITGLDPVKASISTSQFSNSPGGAFTGSVLPVRNIVLTLNPNPDWVDWTVESLRKLIYLYFQPQLAVQLVFEDDVKPPVTIFGYVESVLGNQFTKDGTFQISIICPYPYFTSLNPIVVTGTTHNAYTPRVITYNGDVESGIKLEVDYVAGQSFPGSIGIQTGSSPAFVVTTPQEVDTHQYFIVSSVAGNKYVDGVRTATAVVVSMLSHLNSAFVWPKFEPGNNSFDVVTDAGIHNYTLTYYERFGGL